MSDFKVGDKVRLKDRPVVTGTITDMRITSVFGLDASEFKVKYDDEDLIPSEDWHVDGFLEQIYNTATKPINRCQCGLKYARSGGRHSSWCQMYVKEIK